jgi:hypothetical protein
MNFVIEKTDPFGERKRLDPKPFSNCIYNVKQCSIKTIDLLFTDLPPVYC